MTTFDTSSLHELKQLQSELLARLTHFRRTVRTRLILAGIARLLAEIFITLLLTFILDRYLRLGIPARLGLLLIAIGYLAVRTWHLVIVPLKIRLGLLALAGAIERAGHAGPPHLAAHIASILELPRLLESNDPPSLPMIDRAVRRCHEALAGFQFDSVFDQKRQQKTITLITAALLLPALLTLLFPATTGLWARRLFLLSSQPWPQSTYLVLADAQNGHIRVPRGEPYVLRVQARENSRPPARVALTIKSTSKTTVQMKQFAPNDFRHDFAVIDQPLSLYLAGGDDEVGPIIVDPVDRPRVTALELLSQHPRQPAPEHHSFTGSEGGADLNFLPQTRLTLTIASNVPLSELHLKTSSPNPTAADLHRTDDTHYAVTWTQTAPARFDLELVAADSGLVSLPVPVTIGLKADQPPRVTISYTGVRPRITPQAQIPLTVDARDDFGILRAVLAMRDETPDPTDPAKLVPRDTTRELYPMAATAPATQPALEKDLQLKQPIDVAALKLPPGSLLTFSVDATDDCYTGNQVGHSRLLTFRLVPPEELFREILLRQQAERVKFRKQAEEAEKIRDALAVATDARQAADIARRHRALQREVLRITTVLEESLTEIKLNALGSQESHEIMDRTVLKPLHDLQTEVLAPQVTALDTLAPTDGTAIDSSKIQAAASREEEMISRMRTILKQMAQWDSFVDVLNQLDEIIKLETQVKDQSDKIQKKDTEGLFEK